LVSAQQAQMTHVRRGILDHLLEPLLALNALLAYVFLYLPIAMLVLFSFSTSRYASIWGGFSLEWYAKLVRNPDLSRALWNSLLIAAATTLPIQVWSMVKRGVTPEINALSTLMLLTSITLVTLSVVLYRRR
jgi:ABC-type spermidine/putrescine transport system permease subunit II